MFSEADRHLHRSGFGRVRSNTPSTINRQIDEQTQGNIKRYRNSSPSEISRRLLELDREWDIERLIQLHASAVGLTGLVLGVTRNRKWLAIPTAILSFLLLHSMQGWYPPLPVFRALGFRTRQEINEEKNALMTQVT